MSSMRAVARTIEILRVPLEDGGTSKPARIVEIFRETEYANPIVLINEIDKTSGSVSNEQELPRA
jgi:hypothetical protein